MKDLYYLVPFYTGETATMWHPCTTNFILPVLNYIPEKLTKEIIAAAFCGYVKESELSKDMTDEEFSDLDHFTNMNTIALIKLSNYTELMKEVTNLWEKCEDDSSSYDACEEFGFMIKHRAVKIFDMWGEDNKLNI